MGDFENLLRDSVQPDYGGLKRNLRRQGTPDRVYFMELLEDPEVNSVANYVPLENYLVMLDEGRRYS